MNEAQQARLRRVPRFPMSDSLQELWAILGEQ